MPRNKPVYHAGLVVTVVSEMFRIATGTLLKSFKDEAAARAWLATSRPRP